MGDDTSGLRRLSAIGAIMASGVFIFYISFAIAFHAKWAVIVLTVVAVSAIGGHILHHYSSRPKGGERLDKRSRMSRSKRLAVTLGVIFGSLGLTGWLLVAWPDTVGPISLIAAFFIVLGTVERLKSRY